MAENTEIEAKILLPQEIFQKLCSDFTVKESFNQENYYFDTSNRLLKKNKISCRIRIFSDRAEQTLKVPNQNPLQNKFHEAIEINDKLSLKEAQDYVQNGLNNQHITFKYSAGKYLNQHFDHNLQLDLQTYSKTHRILANGPENCELTFDDSTYPDGYEDFELEIENTNPQTISVVLDKLKKEYGFTQTKSNTNRAKIARAYIHRVKI